ncbi:MAG TPA: glycosyltransferase family 2 protein [Rubricoccaceae bacterium]|nr:glycosyltransferase family 2 protein [Rubricoccaceae bacterium]
MRTVTARQAPPTVTTEAFDVSVVIVNYNVREFLEQALASVERASGGLRVEVFVVDNDSADGSAQMVRARFPQVRLITNEANVGFARANNQAIREANGRYLLILNPDTLLQEDTLHALVRFMDAHPEAGAVGCRILNPDGTFALESRRAFPTPEVAFYRMMGLSRLFPHSPRFGRYNLTYLPKDEVCEVDALSGSCMMVRHAALYQQRAAVPAGDGAASTPEGGAGLLDEDFFMYGEDLDWCYRIQQSGWRIYYTPETQIIHYKGESTRKGELRYVRLFYGAMLRFVEKHLSAAPSASSLQRLGLFLLTLGIRLGIVVRAGVGFVGRLFAAVRPPLADFALAGLAMALAAWVRSALLGSGFSPLFYTVVAPAYALAAVLGVAVAGGYGRLGRRRLRPVLVGLPAALVAVSTLSFFFKGIAFSRVALLLGFIGAGVLLVLRRRLRGHEPAVRRVLLVGAAADAARLLRLVGGRLQPAVQVLGYVGEDAGASAVPCLGQQRHLRDLVRLQGADEVVFAADSLSNTAILGGMQQLRDLPVRLKILTAGRDYLIGKASVEDFSVPLLEAERLVAPLRSAGARRAFEVPVAALGTLAHPLVRALARLRPEGPWRRLAAATARMPSVLGGRRALIGYDPAGPHPPPAWGLLPGVVSVLDTFPERPATIVETHRAYWFYARHQSAALDAQLLLRALLR